MRIMDLSRFDMTELPQVPNRPVVLVIDDQPTNIQLLYALLSEHYDVQMATSGEAAMQLVHESPPDLVLLDIQMPGVSGVEVCARLKASSLTADIPIIFVTAQSTPDEEARCFKIGAVDFVAKPFNPEVVQARIATHVRLKQQTDLLRSLSRTDGLTGLTNRRHFDTSLDAEWRRCRRNGSPLAAIMIDVDYFKAYNDHYGHQQGDACLRQVAQELAKHLDRSHDVLARYGGEEFVCLLPECDGAGALSKAEAMRSAVEALSLAHERAAAGCVTISAGIHGLMPTDALAPASLVELADQRLYEAKTLGRNRVQG